MNSRLSETNDFHPDILSGIHPGSEPEIALESKFRD